MRCQFNGLTATNCLCRNVTSMEPATTCNKTIDRNPAKNDKWSPMSKGNAYGTSNTWGANNYSDPKHCWKMNVMTHRPLGSICKEHAECDKSLYCNAAGTCAEWLSN